MLMNAEEYVAENSYVPACYNSLSGVYVLLGTRKQVMI